MRTTFDVRLDGHPAYFFAFDHPWWGDPHWPGDDPLADELLAVARSITRGELSEVVHNAGVEVRNIEASWGSLDIRADLTQAVTSPELVFYVAAQARDILLQQAVLKAAHRIWDWLRGSPSLAMPSVPEAMSYGGDLLAIARRVAAHEASLGGCGISLAGTEIQSGGYKATFSLIGVNCSGEAIVVTVDYSGAGYRLKRRRAARRALA